MTNIKRIILTRQQLNEVLSEAGYYVDTGEAGNNNAADAIDKLSSADAAQEYNNLNNQMAGENPPIVIDAHSQSTNPSPIYAGEANSPSDAARLVNKDPNLKNLINKGNPVNINIENEHKCFSKRQIEEARLRKIHEGHKMTKKELQESFDTDEQWAHEIKMFMDGLRRGDYMLDDDTLYVEIFRGQTSENDPRYAYIRKGENRLHDDHFYMQDSPTLSDSQLKDIYYNAGWEDMLPELIDYNGFEMYESKIEIDPNKKGTFNAIKKRTGKTTEELTHSKNPKTRKKAIFAQNAKKWNKK